MSLPFRSILVPLEFDAGASASLQLAKELAIRDHAKVCILHVIPLREAILCEQHRGAVEPSEESWPESEARRKLQEMAQTILGANVSYRIVTRIGDPTNEILRASEELGIDLVVMATHGRNGVWRITLGSVAEKVVRKSACPVLTTHPEPSLTACA